MFKKIIYLGIACSVSSFLYGAGCSSQKDEKPVKKHDPMLRKREMRPIPQFTAKPKPLMLADQYPSYEKCLNQSSFLMSANFLFMRSRNESLIYAYESKTIQTPGSLDNFVKQGQMIRPNYIWKPGFKVGLGLSSSHRAWDTEAHWMYYYNQTNDSYVMDPILLGSTNNNNAEGFWPYWVVVNDTASGANALERAYYQGIASSWKLVYNMLDWTIGRVFKPVSRLKVRPNIGVKNGWIHQRVSIEYSTSFLTSSNQNDKPLDTQVIQNNNYWGIGLTTGLESDWNLGAGFSIKSSVSSSILSGRTDVRRIVNGLLPGLDYNRLDNQSDRVQQFAPGMEMLLGIGWEVCSKDQMQTFGIDIAWQSIYWWNQFDFYLPKNDLSGSLRQQVVMEYSSKNKPLNLEGAMVNIYYWF